MKKLLLIDAMAGLYRAHFALIKQPMTSPRGQNVAALFGFVNTLFALIEREQPDRLVVCSDTAEPTLRHQAFDAYKATRDEMPEDLQVLVPMLYSMLQAMNIKVLLKPGYEADDIMATLALRARASGEYQPVIVSADKDLMQLLQYEGVRMISPSRTASGEWSEIDSVKVNEKYGIGPEQLGDWLAMVGDTSDNIPGIPKIGGKSATTLLLQYGSLNAILERAEEIEKNSWRETIIANTEQARLSRKLVELVYDVPLEVSLDDFEFGPFTSPEFQQQLNELGFRGLLKKVVGLSADELTVKEARDYQLVNTRTGLNALCEALNASELTALDTETTDIDPNRAILVGISVSMQDREGYFIHLPTFEGYENIEQPPSGTLFGAQGEATYPAQSEVIERLRSWLENPQVKKCGQHFKYDTIVFAKCGVTVRGWSADPMLMSYLIDPNSRTHGIDVLSQKYLQLPKIPTEALLGSGKSQRTMAEVAVDQIVEYASEDADYTRRLAILLRNKIAGTGLEKVHDEIELPLAEVLARMEMTGIKIDTSVLAGLSRTFSSEQLSIESQVHAFVGHPFNLGSPMQLAKVLFEELQMKPVRKTKTGFSTDEDVLHKLTHQDPTIPVPAMLLRYRMLSKLRGTYIEALPKLIHPETGRVHTSYNQAVAATGRLSSTDPNLQNIPIRSEEGAKIRTAFIAGHAGWKLLSADYSQIELRLMAHLSQDATLCEAFRAGHDIHVATAAKVHGIPLAEVTREQRSAAKAVNFGIIYGQTDYGLSESLDITMHEAKQFREQYFATYPGVQRYMAETVAFAREHGYVETMLGRRRPMPDILSDNRATREFAERMAINTPIQGTAADIIKIAMIKIDRRLEQMRREGGLRAKMLLQVHDELVFEAPVDELEMLSELVKTEMESALPLSVPLVADLGTGDNWLEAH